MTVILVLVTFLVFILLDYVLSRRKAAAVSPVEAPQAAAPEPEMGFVDGFLVPERLAYHAGHTWAVRERRNLVRVGVDEFAAALLGKLEKIEAPKPGQWIRQGQRVWSFFRNGQKTEMVSPTEGEIVEINPEVVKNPALVRRDPYGLGWLALVHVPDEESTTRNLIPAALVRDWMRSAAERLYARQPRLAGAVAADGGRPAEDLLAGIPELDWKEVTGEFFLTA
jgi:glycine cleavage system H lipoate-binding protein